jgi:D-arabinose 1-dehydrogenase-like Zn-dependent alcohol dehydrogenase
VAGALTYLAAVYPAPNVPIEIREFPEPELEPGAALLHTLYSEVCGTDVHLLHGRLAGVPYPIIPGHVSVGAVAKVRGAIETADGDPVKEGDVVTFLDVHETCNNCYHCLVAGQPNRCPSRKVYGITYSAADGLLGGWSQAIYMKPGVKMIHIPQGLAPETFIGGGCGLVTALHAVDLARIRLAESVAVLGVGPVGQSCVALASLSGAGEIVAVDGVADRLEYATRMGATHTIGLDLPRVERLSRARGLTKGRGLDVVIEASGAPEAVGEALDLVREGGRVIVCGHYTDNGPLEIHPHWQINRKHVELRGCWGSRFEHFHRAVALAARFGGQKPWRQMVGGTYPLREVAAAVGAVEARKAVKAVLAMDGASSPAPGLSSKEVSIRTSQEEEQ